MTFHVVVLLCVLPGEPTPPQRAGRGHAGDQPLPACGVAAVYAALKLLERPVPLEALERQFHRLRPGMRLDRLSLADLRRVVEQHGLPARALRVIPSGKLPVPAILYIRPERLPGGPSAGHFVLLRHGDASSVEVIEFQGVPRVVRIPRQVLFAHWDGELLALGNEARQASRATWLGPVALLSVAVVSGIICWRLWR